ncbi:hypothetical protein AB4Y85_00630 [Microvirga sp. 2YAF29]|uniref:hypothetical protein n=1 Tax=Microvirga sp. 2YAF29 TaxID=3233031 RepID=UPI003F961F84
MRTTMGPAQKLHLDRAARTAGEAFAFEEPDTTPVTRSAYGSSLLWLAIAVVAVLALSYAF